MVDADTTLSDLIAQIARENDWKDHEVNIKPITSGGANYTSALYLVNISLPDRDVKLFAKVASVGEKMRAAMTADRLFHLEAYFYKKLSKTYDELQAKLDNEDKFVYPKFYGCNTQMFKETVVLENLVARGYGSYSRFKSVDWEHATSSVEALAKFHALSFAYQKKNPEEYKVVCEDLRFQRNVADESVKNLWAGLIKSRMELIKEEGHRERLNKLFKEGWRDVFVRFRFPQSTPVIAHGDYRASNILYKKQGTKIHAIPVDYQTLHTGSPAADLVYFETLGTDSAFRAEHHDRLMNHYYCELEKALKRLDVDATEVYPRETFDDELKKTLPYAAVVGITILPIVLVEAADAPRVDGDVELESFLVSGTDVYAERFTGIIEDCVRWGAF